MSRGTRQRRRRVIVEGFHGRFVLVHLAWIVGLLAVFVSFLFLPLMGPLLTVGSPGRQAAADGFLLLHETVWPLLFGLFAASAAVVIHMSHRVAGPLFRFRKVFDQVSSGDLTAAVVTRRRDYLHAEAAALSAMVAELRGRVSRAQTGVTEVARDLVRLQGRTATVPQDFTDIAADVARVEATLAEFKTKPSADDSTSAQAFAPPGIADEEVLAGSARPGTPRRRDGFTMVEILIAVAIVIIVASIGTARYFAALEVARIVKAIADIDAFSVDVNLYKSLNACLPSSLAELGHGSRLDPWGRPYVYNVLASVGGGGGGGGGRGGDGGGGGGTCAACDGACGTRGDARKDRRLVPLNSDFDLYSIGRDGRSAGPLTAPDSQDDVIRASDGAFIGLARNY